MPRLYSPVARCRSVAEQPALGQKMLLLHSCGELVLPGRLLVEELIPPGPPIIWYLALPPPSVLESKGELYDCIKFSDEVFFPFFSV